MGERVIRQAGVITFDNPRLFENVEAAGTGGLRQADLFRQRRVGEPAFPLKRLQNGDINPVESQYPRIFPLMAYDMQEITILS
jgi:hypothetical protein